ncbi:endonuclease V [Sporosarcina jeotgali]|uniref:Endonuclease V n=1 Tax=Sporosarcina jeotgali TaxID=3020056 RepID=A0ABZ0L0V3_9BACL|nr:endonuclease V [Sporosarcina sp. B2O-1]WOV85820.1 endonuclease V [Sporosarcina sp. B2O-1]
MKVFNIHPFDIDAERFPEIQSVLSERVVLKDSFKRNDIRLVAGVDVAYCTLNGNEYGICCILVINVDTMKVIERTVSADQVTVPYIPGYLAFRELPLILKAAEKLTCTPDLFMFDGNGILHPRKMGIATHASFFLNRPTIGIAKSYYRIADVSFTSPSNANKSFEDIVIGNEVYGRALRTHKDVKPIFVSCGNYIELSTAAEITLHLINRESRLPIPVRLADIETKRLKRLLVSKT